MRKWQARLLDAGAAAIVVFAIADTLVGPASVTLNIVIFGSTFAIAIAYVAHLTWANPMSDLRRWLWAFGLIIFAPVAIPLYWWFYLAPDQLRTPGRPPGPRFRQVDRVTAGLAEIGLLGVPWEEFSAMSGVTFTDGRATVELRGGEVFGLEHHGDEPYPGVFLLGRLDDDLEGQRKRFAAAAGVPASAFRFIRDEESWRDARSGEVVT